MSGDIKEYRNFINGKWVASRSGRTFQVENPATRETIGKVPEMDGDEVAEAIEAAHRQFPIWASLTAGERSRYMYRIYEEILRRKEAIARVLTMEQGKPLKEAVFEVMQAAEFMLWYGEEAKRLYGETIPSSSTSKRILALKQPVGVTAAIIPWNFPASMVTRKLAPALAAGCTVVLKPAEQTPLTAIAIFEAMEAAGLPSGVANLVTGNPSVIGPVLSTHPLVKKITFTGSTNVGKLLFKNAADTVKRLSLELGGHAPFIVFDDADLDLAAENLVESKFRNNGQVCISPNRVYVQQSIVPLFADKVKERMERLRIGNGLEEDIDIGPMIDGRSIQKVVEHITDAEAKGALSVRGGQRISGSGTENGYFYEPTLLLHATEDMIIAKEETFGPVAPMFSFETEEEVIERANNSDYGLSAYVFTSNMSRAIRLYERLEYGIVGVNDALPTVPSTVQAPFGGFKQSGLGREGGHHGIEQFLEVKYVSIRI